uniref:Asparagine synthetase domain-containing protein C4F611c (Trinotate prediction) n=1 Tax=Henneguya salminicola TaxID=69463 RepID=A0A6G3MI76_HENSL
MCGIISILSYNYTKSNKYKGIYKLLDRRGPDCIDEKLIKICIDSTNACFLDLFMRGSVLSIRSPLTSQPICLNKNILLFNGQIYEGIDVYFILLTKILPIENDGLKLAHCLNNYFDGAVESLRKLLYSINGEYAFIYYHV